MKIFATACSNMPCGASCGFSAISTGRWPTSGPKPKLYPQRAAADFHIGIMGLGEIGGYIADQLARLGYRVSGWSRSESSWLASPAIAARRRSTASSGRLTG